jgi:hypothetical protein
VRPGRFGRTDERKSQLVGEALDAERSELFLSRAAVLVEKVDCLERTG